MNKAALFLRILLLSGSLAAPVRGSAALLEPESVAIAAALSAALAPDRVEQHAVLAWHTISMRQTPVADYAFLWVKTAGKNNEPHWALVQLVRVSGSTDALRRQWQIRRVGGEEQLQRFDEPPDTEQLYGFLKHWGWRSDSCSYSVNGHIDETTWTEIFHAAPHVDYVTDTAHCQDSP